MSKKLRVGFVGAGGIARTHMKYLDSFDDVELVAVSDVSEQALGLVKEQFGLDNHYSTWTEMLEKEDLDAVDVCTPNGLHYQPTIDALNAGRHVMVEKPLAMNADEGQEMVDTAEKTGQNLTIGFQWRYHAVAQMFRKAAAEGQFGKIMFLRAQALRRRGIPNWGVFGRKDLQGGGPMIDIGVHIMEMSHYIMGSPKPVSASGNIYTYMGNKPSDVASQWPNWDHETYTVEDLAVGQVRFENGAVMHVESSFAGHLEDKFSFTFMGEKGGGQFEPATMYADQAGHMMNITPAFVPKVDMFETKMRKWVDTCLNGTPNEAPGTVGLSIQKMIDAIYKSGETGQEVAID
jgi:predicted dehydrogenase